MNKISPLQTGEKAPDFTFENLQGETSRLTDLKGFPVLVYFYPKDDTPGCTKEACAFRDHYADFSAAGIHVIGVSIDDEKSHTKFREKYELPFALASDPDQKIVNAYGVWGEKKFMGKTYEGTHRVSFLVGPDGLIAKVYPKVKPAEHAAEVLADAKSLY